MTGPDGTSRLLASWVAGAESADLTADDRRLVKVLVLDFLRALAIGSRASTTESARAFAESMGGTPESTILVYGDRTDAARAAFVNGAMGHATDIDDTHVAAMLHPAAAVIPAVFALAERADAGGEDVMIAIASGYEVAVRISLAVQPGHFRRGFQATGTCGTFGAAAAASRVLRSRAEMVAGALGVAGSMAGGLAQFYYSGSNVKRVHAGIAAHNGVVATLLAHHGIHGPGDVLEGQAGFAAAYADGFDESAIVTGLGDRWAVRDVSLKPHATSARLQSATEAVLGILRIDTVDPRSVTAIRVDIPEVIAGRLTRPDPPDVTAAQMSLPFTIATSVVASYDRGRPLVALVGDDYREYLDDPRTRALARLTTCRVDERVTAQTLNQGIVPANVSIELNDGRRLTRTVDAPPGSRIRPFTEEEHLQHFHASVDGLIPDESAKATAEAVQNLEEPGSVAEIARHFVRASRDASG